MAKPLSAKLVIKVLCREFSFSLISQKGSHIKLGKTIKGKTIITIVPNHKELAPGTLKGVLALAQVDEKEFRDKC